VTVVEMCDRPLALNLDEYASSLVRTKFEENGIIFRTSCRVLEFLKDSTGRVRGVVIDDGTEIACQLIVVAVGVSPRTELAKAAGIAVNKGIVVDEFMRTSAPDVYAAGDVAEAYDLLLDVNRLIPIWPNAYLEGRTAGLAMAGKPVPFRGEIPMNAAHFYGFPVMSAGITEPPHGCEEIMEKSPDNGCYRRIILKDKRAIGMIMTGDAVDRAGLLLNLIKNKTDVADFMDKLESGGFNNARLPGELRASKQLGREKI
jgi:NAD(P)H-nitrite reductase large subunit